MELPDNSSATDTDSQDSREKESSITEDLGQGQDQKKPVKLFPIFQRNFKPESNPLKDIQLAFTESCKAAAAKRPRRSLLGKTETPGMSQMTLDAGQKHIGPHTCADCSCYYSPGAFEDEEVHRKLHMQHQNLHSIRLWKGANILQTFLDGGSVIMVQGGGKDSKAIMKRLRDFIAWVDSELGAGAEPTFSSSSQRIFMYVLPTKRKTVVRILGCAVMEVISDPNTVAAYTIPAPGAEINEDEPEVRILVGITRLWTDKDFRKKHIAKRLCEKIRFHSGITGCIVPFDKLGILEPSDDGKAFMFQFTNGTGAAYTYKLVESLASPNRNQLHR